MKLLTRVLIASLVILALGGIALVAGGWAVYSGARTSTVGELGFRNELAIPPLLEPREQDGRTVFDLALEQGTTELLPGKPTETWGVNGPYLGPTLRADRGDEVVVRVRNELPDTTTVHWHGMHLPAEADGGLHQPIAPGEVWAPSWRIEQPAATLWYHPHPHGETADHVYRGLAGMFILDDPAADALALPQKYGVDDIPLIIEDKRLNDDGSLDYGQSMISPTGRLGNTILVNGTYDPHLEIRDSRVRLRLLNASTARIYDIGFADERHFDLVATDGGLLERPEPMTRVQLSPGERAEIVARFHPGERVVLRSFEPDLGTNFFEGRFAGADDSFDLLQIRAAPSLSSSPEIPDRLAPHAHVDEGDAARTRRFELSGSAQINGKHMDMARIDEVVTAGSTEIWEVRNDAGTPHNFHIHGVSFRVLDDGGDPPPPHLRASKDTVYVPPGKTVRALVHFEDYPDPDSPYMFHCHVLQHEDRGMMGQFVVVEPGQEHRVPEHDHLGRHS
jgi:FtsP/CotA-like multicopper oxidase with cupredoxin domain